MSGSEPSRWTRRGFLHWLGGAGLLAGLAPLAGCGGGAKDQHTIRMNEALRFEPPELTIRAGDTVTWRNTSDFVHTATADPGKVRDPNAIALPPGAESWDSGNIAPKQTWSYRFQTAGRYQYVCVPHASMGMTGTITVEA